MSSSAIIEQAAFFRRQVFEKDADRDLIKAFFEENGYVIVRVLNKEECLNNIKAQVKHVLLKQPWLETLEVKDEMPLDFEKDPDRYVSVLTRDKLTKSTLQHYESVWPLHAGFGACCDPQVFHLEEVWRIRENTNLYNIASTILQKEELWVEINRSIQKLPGKGEDEFLHWDVDFLNEKWAKDESISGKLMFTSGTFICVPGTSTKAFHELFKENYGMHYHQQHKAKLGLDPKKSDPLNLKQKRVSIPVPAGCAIFWSKWLLHGVQRNPLDAHIQFGTYIGYMPAVSRKDYKRKAGIEEAEDRIHSFKRGCAPKLWPSLDKIHYYPFRYNNFPQHLKPFTEKTREDWPGRATKTIKSGPKKGEVLDDLLPVIDEEYVRPKLSKLGKRLLGKKPWPVRCLK
jgi:hypothetical protein